MKWPVIFSLEDTSAPRVPQWLHDRCHRIFYQDGLEYAVREAFERGWDARVEAERKKGESDAD